MGGEKRKGDYIQTFSGRQFWPLDPRPEEVFIEDIAHALSCLCRFGGHCRVPYSVAEHSVHVSEFCSPEDALWGLLHDAAEAYVIDVPKPLKMHLTGYAEIEARVTVAILERFGLKHPEPESVIEADARMLFTECRDLMRLPSSPWNRVREPYEVSLAKPWSHLDAEEIFLQRYYRLTNPKDKP